MCLFPRKFPNNTLHTLQFLSKTHVHIGIVQNVVMNTPESKNNKYALVSNVYLTRTNNTIFKFALSKSIINFNIKDMINISIY